MIEQIIGSLVEVGFPPREALESIFAVGRFVLGSALERQAEARHRIPMSPSGTGWA